MPTYNESKNRLDNLAKRGIIDRIDHDGGRSISFAAHIDQSEDRENTYDMELHGSDGQANLEPHKITIESDGAVTLNKFGQTFSYPSVDDLLDAELKISQFDAEMRSNRSINRNNVFETMKQRAAPCIIRPDSSGDSNKATVSLYIDGSVQHYKITKLASGEFKFDTREQTFPHLDDLVQSLPIEASKRQLMKAIDADKHAVDRVVSTIPSGQPQKRSRTTQYKQPDLSVLNDFTNNPDDIVSIDKTDEFSYRVQYLASEGTHSGLLRLDIEVSGDQLRYADERGDIHAFSGPDALDQIAQHAVTVGSSLSIEARAEPITQAPGIKNDAQDKITQ